MSSGAKKEKSFNGTKAKFSPNAAVPEKKAEVKLRRKESEKVKQPSDPNRKSVLGRFFHNLVDSDDSRKKAAAADAKKKKGRDAVGSDLDLPEHGIVLRKPQTLQRDQQLPGAIPSPRTRAMTLANQGGRDNRNRWSSYDIQASNFTEGMLPPTVPETDYSTMGHRSQSEETLNALLMADPPRSMSKVKDSFITHSDSARQPDTMRKHAQLLQSIQETKANRSSRSDKTIDARSGQGSNGYLLTTEMVIDGPKKDASSITGNNSDQKLNDLQKASSCDSADSNRELRPQNQTANSSSDALVLLDEKNKQIDKAMADKRKILSQLFGVAEEDLNNLLEKDVDLSTDLSVRKMILISLLQSDQLTSAISGLLVPLNSGCADGAVDKEAAVATGDKCLKEKASSSQSQLLHKVASRLHSHLTLLQQIVDRDVAETDRLKKDLEEAQLQIKKKSMPPEAKVDLPEVSLDSDKVVEQSADLSVSTEAPGGDIESLSNTVDNVPESTSKQDTQTTVNTDQNVADRKEKAEEVLPLVEELVYITEHVMEEQLFSADTDDKTDIKLSSDVSQNVSPHVDECIETADAEVHTANEVIVLNDKDTSGHQQESVPSSEVVDVVQVSPDGSVKDVIVPAEVKEDYQIDLQDVNDNLEKLLDEADEAGNPYHSDSNRKFMNLESIPEDDDRLSCCDVELKVCASENLYQELVLKCHIEVTVEDEVETIFSTEVETKSDLKDDARPIVEDNVQSNFKEDFLPSANDVQSAVADDVQFSVGDAQSDVKTDSLSNTPDDFQAIVDNAPSNVQGAAPPSVGNTPLHVHGDIQSSAADDARSHAQKDTRSDTEDDPRSNLDKIQASGGDGEDSCQGQVPTIIADVNRESGDNLQERESTLIEEKFPQILAGPESLESQEEEEEEEEDLEGETEQDDLGSDTDTETSMQLEKKSVTESETDEELESEDEEESDVLKMLETALLESDSKDESSDLEAERRLAVDSENASEQILNGPDIASDQLMQVEEISFSDSILEERETAEINEPKAVVDSSLHNHVEKESVERDEGFSHENTKSEISEVVSELLDLNECDKITIVSSGKE